MQDRETDKKTSQAIAGAIRAAMARRRTSQKALREQLAWSVSYLGRRIGGEVEMSAKDLLAIAGVLQCDPAELVTAAMSEVDSVEPCEVEISMSHLIALAAALGRDPAELITAAAAAAAGREPVGA